MRLEAEICGVSSCPQTGETKEREVCACVRLSVWLSGKEIALRVSITNIPYVAVAECSVCAYIHLSWGHKAVSSTHTTFVV